MFWEVEIYSACEDNIWAFRPTHIETLGNGR